MDNAPRTIFTLRDPDERVEVGSDRELTGFAPLDRDPEFVFLGGPDGRRCTIPKHRLVRVDSWHVQPAEVPHDHGGEEGHS